MTGQIAFARTLRAVNADDLHGSKLTLLLAIIILALWTWWIFAARIPQYEISEAAQLETGNSATANFPPTTHIRSGQHAQITTTDGATIEAEVANVQNEPTGPTHVTFTLFPSAAHQSPTPSPQPQPARASVEITRISPASSIRRALR